MEKIIIMVVFIQFLKMQNNQPLNIILTVGAKKCQEWEELHIAGGYYHVMGLGLQRRRIFATNTDKEDFLGRADIEIVLE